MKITPNKISLMRIFLVPFMVFFYLASFIPCGKIIAIVCFALASLTDFIDGQLARKTGQVTDLGKFLDPIADKLLQLAGLVLIIADGTVAMPYGAIMVIILLTRDNLVSGLRQIAAQKNVVISADMWAKYKSFIAYLAIPAFMLVSYINEYGIASGTFYTIFLYLSYALLIVATLLTIISCVVYFTKNRAVFQDKK